MNVYVAMVMESIFLLILLAVTLLRELSIYRKNKSRGIPFTVETIGPPTNSVIIGEAYGPDDRRAVLWRRSDPGKEPEYWLQEIQHGVVLSLKRCTSTLASLPDVFIGGIKNEEQG